MSQLTDDLLEDTVYPEPAVPNWMQAIELIATANEVGKALGWRPMCREEREMLDDARISAACYSDKPSIPGML